MPLAEPKSNYVKVNHRQAIKATPVGQNSTHRKQVPVTVLVIEMHRKFKATRLRGKSKRLVGPKTGFFFLCSFFSKSRKHSVRPQRQDVRWMRALPVCFSVFLLRDRHLRLSLT